MTLRTLGHSCINKLISRSIFQTSALSGKDGRDKRLGHKPKTDKVEGEAAAIGVSEESFELVDENLLNTLIDNVRFKDIPVININSTRNNTKVTLITSGGGIHFNRSAGMEGYKNCRKGTTVAAQAVANRVLTYAEDHDIKMARMVFNGLGPGRNAAFKVFELSKLKIVSLSDRTQAIEPWILRPRKAKRI